jgi:3'(2'), 5'-bisphosphate nucleotidase
VPSEDAELATRLAAEVGELLLAVRDDHPAAEPRELGALGDREAQRLVDTRLSAERPADAMLSEEAADDGARLTADRVWIIDPLDGTWEFARRRADWAVHVALWQRGSLAAGAVALPDLGVLLSTDPAPMTPSGPLPGRLRLAVSRSRPPALARALAERLDLDLVPMGSAGVKAAAVVRGEVDAYLHSGGLSEWDSAAPVAVALAAGLHASRVDGSPLVYNQPDVSLPDLLVCRAELARTLLDEIAALLR